ncbi:phosphoribosyl-AMP cyclohydrolase [Candidatus Kirkpatrickella diaphorinae]|uniref:Phosphoribosyl-AMP cyclohydrolase n=1 Tax=Candidatus Kirkpatrickella diaphorinae TaxID=2984322 RepID=A0ABY6GJ78_9PROT|nr:phosphoribosyl-AMP cyclohydrolase [Candidatus Kirkpatrickella diaphorinae]UYH51577.1 phosphoribosyl-AMP cyclohydrolase [Candidatus Kirkpatrickella diaphorinae]
MTQTYNPPSDTSISEILQKVRFDADGLVAAIAQSATAPHEVLMLAWMDEGALRETLTTGRVCYYSRSRQKLWRKGETSGQVQSLVSAMLDCDGDAVLLRVAQQGVACHTGRRSCFYLSVTPGGLVENAAPEIAPEKLYPKA